MRQLVQPIQMITEEQITLIRHGWQAGFSKVECAQGYDLPLGMVEHVYGLIRNALICQAVEEHGCAYVENMVRSQL